MCKVYYALHFSTTYLSVPYPSVLENLRIESAADATSMLGKILLVVILGAPKFSGGDNFCHRAGGFGFFRRFLLLRRVIKNDGAILTPDIRPLAVHLCRIVNRPKRLQ